MNPLFLNNLLSELDELGYDTVVLSQDGVKEYLEEELEDGVQNFPMICFEYTNDSNFEVDINESKFLNNSVHEGCWILGQSDNIGFILNIKDHKDILEIDVLEVGEHVRGTGLGREIVESIEDCAEEFFGSVIVSPFDTDAINFWEHMDYIEQSNGFWRRRL